MPVKYNGVNVDKVKYILANYSRDDAAKAFNVKPNTISIWRQDLGLSTAKARKEYVASRNVDALIIEKETFDCFNIDSDDSEPPKTRKSRSSKSPKSHKTSTQEVKDTFVEGNTIFNVYRNDALPDVDWDILFS